MTNCIKCARIHSNQRGMSMKNNNFIIEVKTKWEERDNKYTRKVIEYTCPCEFDLTDESLYSKFLEPTNTYDESSHSIKNNEIEIKAINKDNKNEIENPSVLIKTLLEFTKYQWLKGE